MTFYRQNRCGRCTNGKLKKGSVGELSPINAQTQTVIIILLVMYSNLCGCKVTANLRGCPPEKNSYSCCFQENLHKLDINRKAMKCRIREKY